MSLYSITGRTIRPGDIVYLCNPDPEYSIGDINPAVGTPYFCKGEYVGGPEVVWANERSNTYKDGELIHLEDYENTAEGECETIW